MYCHESGRAGWFVNKYLNSRLKSRTLDPLHYISFDPYSATPKYLQLANSITRAIREGVLTEDTILPSINELSFQFEISRDTAEKGYKYLKNKGILGSVPGKGYYIKQTRLDQEYQILLLFNKLSPHKKTIYDAFVTALGNAGSVDLYIYNNDFHLFKKILQNAGRQYTHYVILPHFKTNREKAYQLIDEIPKDKLIMMDHLVEDIEGNFGAVYEDFENDIFHSLEKALKLLSKYSFLKLIIPRYNYYPESITEGFKHFCNQYDFRCKVINSIVDEPITGGQVYVVVTDEDLVQLVEKILCTRLKVGKDIGIISYNENPLKKVVLNGITTISTDFSLMGKETAEMILHRRHERIRIPFQLFVRNSL